jgi:type II secretory pathway pseudopilin PulG
MSNREVNPNDRTIFTLQRFNISTFQRGEVRRAFTVIELVVVVGIIVILSGLVLSTVGYARKKVARARADAEIAAISAACENYKADNGVYPIDCSTTSQLNSTSDGNPVDYATASRYLYGELTGDRDFDGTIDSGGKAYMSFKPTAMLRSDMSQPPSSSNRVTAIADPFGNSYGYSTAYANYLDYQSGVSNCSPPTSPNGYNPTFDLWSTAGVAPSPTPSPPATQQDLWIKNW